MATITQTIHSLNAGISQQPDEQKIPGQVKDMLNAIPDITKTDTIPWEEWFMMENEIHHHVLFSVKHEKSTMTWQGEQDDKDHPKQVLGVLWHVYNDMSITPFLNQ